MVRAWIAAGVLALGAASAVRAQVAPRQTAVPEEYGLDLATASPVMRYASDVTFDGDTLHARRGVMRLGAYAFRPGAVLTTSQTAAPLDAGASYAVNDGSGRTYVVRVIALEGGRVKVSVVGAAASLHWQAPAPPPAAASAHRMQPPAAAGRGTAIPTYGSVAVPTYGSVAVPTYGSVAVPTYGSVPAPTYGNGSVPGKLPPSESQPAQPRSASAAPSVAPPAALAPPPPPLPPLRGRHIALNAYRMEGSSVTKYSFHRDGTFRREFIFHSYVVSNMSEDRGQYAIRGSTLILRIVGRASAATGGVGGDQYQSGGQSANVSEERHRVSLRGSAGIVIDGKLFQRMSGNW